MMKSSKRRVCVVHTHPIQYYAPFYSYLSRDNDIDLEVIYLTDFSLRGAYDEGFGRPVAWDVDLLSGYKYRFIGSHYQSATPNGFFSLIVPVLCKEIFSRRFHAILIHGYAYAANLLVILAGSASGAKILFRGDTNVTLAKKKHRSYFNRLYVNSFFAACDKMLAIGTRNREFYLWMGVPESKIVLAPFSVDNDRFFSSSRLTEEQRRDLRAKYGVEDDRPILIFASKFMRGKRPDLVIRAAGALVNRGLSLHLVMAGSGEMSDELKQISASYPRLSVSYPGFVNQSEMPRLLGACDVFVFPSTIDQWGLIVNEAMAVGLPVVVGEESGCAPDLVENGVNGYRVRSNELTSLVDALEPLVSDLPLRSRMAKGSLSKISQWSFHECHIGWRAALDL